MGFFVDVVCSMPDMCRTKITMRKGRRVPVSVKVDDGETSFRIWLSIEFQPEL